VLPEYDDASWVAGNDGDHRRERGREARRLTRRLHDRRHDHDAPIDGLGDQAREELIRHPRPAHYPPDT
jgi:hypothetical protein